MSGLFGDIGNGVKDIFGRAVKFAQSPYGMAAGASLSRGDGLGQAAFAGNQYAQQQQQMEYQRKLQQDMLRRQMINDAYKQNLMAAQANRANYRAPIAAPTPVKAADGYMYNPQTGKRVFPNVIRQSGLVDVKNPDGKIIGQRDIATNKYTPLTPQKTLAQIREEEKAKKMGNLDATSIVAARQALPKIVGDANESIRLIDEMIGNPSEGIPEHPGFRASVGPIDAMAPTFRGPALDFHARFDQLKGKQFMQAYQSLKGGGQITEVEGKKATDAMSRMRYATTEGEFIKAARDFQDVLTAGVERAKAAAGYKQQGSQNGNKLPSNDPLGLFQ